jgi:hypothetical protein
MGETRRKPCGRDCGSFVAPRSNVGPCSEAVAPHQTNIKSECPKLAGELRL